MEEGRKGVEKGRKKKKNKRRAPTESSPSLSNFSTSKVGLKGPRSRERASVATFSTEDVIAPERGGKKNGFSGHLQH